MSEDQKIFSKMNWYIGEEISDVIIYTTRFSDVTNIDLARAVKAKVSGSALGSPRPQDYDKEEGWSAFTYEELEKYAEKVIHQKSSSLDTMQRSLCHMVANWHPCFLIVRKVKARTKEIAHGGHKTLQIWRVFGSNVTCCCLARTVNIDVAEAIGDKMDKNERKYPLHLAKGSSAKYTKYVAKNVVAENLKLAMTGLAIGFMIGIFIRKRT